MPKVYEPRIKVIKDGPYLVSGSVPLIEQVIVTDADGKSCGWQAGRSYPTGEKVILCRCGHSKTAPFCDGTHKQAHFDGTETAGREDYLDQAEELHGPALTLTDVLPLCADARFCDRAGGTWELTRHSDEPVARGLAIEQASNCPSGRLVAWDAEGNVIEPEFEPSIGIVEDPHENASGPLWVRGGIPIESADGFTYEIRNRVALCRCGRSRNKPFCDGKHLSP